MKKYLVGIPVALACSVVFAKPNTVTITGNLINNLTSSSSQFNYVSTRITLSNPADSPYIKIGDGNIVPNQIFNLVPGTPVPYTIEMNKIGTYDTVTIWMYDSNSNSQCQWYYKPASGDYPILQTATNSIMCTTNFNDIVIHNG